MTKVSIIIPVVDLWDMTLQCLSSLAQTCTQHIAANNIEVIVVDNGSKDLTSTQLNPTLENLFGHCAKGIRLAKNLGFSKACNIGAEAASHPLLFFLNNDTILTENWLDPLIHALESSPQVGMVGPLLLYPDNTVQHCGIFITPLQKFIHLYQHLPATYPPVNKVHKLKAITGAAMLIKAELFNECGKFCEEYINGFEDVDLCYTVWKKNLQILCIPQSKIYHLTSQTPGRFEHDQHNSVLFYKRNNTLPLSDIHHIAIKDGLEPNFDACLKIYISLTQVKKDALNQAFQQKFDPQKCQARLLTEPLWLQGYELLANYYQKQNQCQKALDTWLHLYNIVPSIQSVSNVIRLAKQQNKLDIVENAILIQQDLNKTMAQPQELVKFAHKIKEIALNSNDKNLELMINRWFNHFGFQHKQ